MNISKNLYKRAKKSIPGGVNSPVRAFNQVGNDPIFFNRAKGAKLFDSNNQAYIDYISAWGTMIAGHANNNIINNLNQQAKQGLNFGTPTEIEIIMAEKIKNFIPSIDLIRIVNSGTEATMSAIRLAREYTKRNKIIKFEGCYHGHSDSFLMLSNIDIKKIKNKNKKSCGIPNILSQNTITLPYNDIDKVKSTFEVIGNDIACIIVEPVAGNMNCILPKKGFLEGLRNICNEYKSILIFDEVMTGFRISLGGAQSYYNILPDITTLGKIIGAGIPIGAFGGKKEIMKNIAPLGKIYQAGTHSGNSLAMTAGLSILEEINKKYFYNNLSKLTQNLMLGFENEAKKNNISLITNYTGGMFGFFFTEQRKITNLIEMNKCDLKKFKIFYNLMIKEGVYLAPSAYEAGFISITHNNNLINKTIKIVGKCFKNMNQYN